MNPSEAVCHVLEGSCLKCDGDTKLIEVGGVPDFLQEHFGQVDQVVVLSTSSFYKAALRVLDCKDEDLEDNLALLQHAVTSPYSNPKSTKTERKWEVPEGVEVTVWSDPEGDENPYERGVFIMKCELCQQTYEAYGLLGGDWTLGYYEECAYE